MTPRFLPVRAAVESAGIAIPRLYAGGTSDRPVWIYQQDCPYNRATDGAA